VKTTANGVALLITLPLLLGATWEWGQQLPETEQPVLTTAQNGPTPPTQIKIGGVIYTVELVREVPGAGDGFGLYGRTCDRTAKQKGSCAVNSHIYLEDGRPLIEEQTTLLHEIQHAILGTDKSAKKTTSHHFIYELTPKLLAVLQDNPGVYRYLTATESK